MKGSRARKAFFYSIVFIVAVLLCAGDNHVCVQTGPCYGCTQAQVTLPTIDFTGDVSPVDFGAIAMLSAPAFPPFIVVDRTSLRAPPSVSTL